MSNRPTVPPADGPRRALSVLPALVLAAALGAFAACSAGAPPPAGGEAPAPAPGPLGAAAAALPVDTLTEPPVIRSAPVQVNGRTIRLLDVEMHVEKAYLRLPGGTSDTLRTWRLVRANGQAFNRVGYPGPTFRVQPGDSIRILLVNNLPPDASETACQTYTGSSKDVPPNCLHGPNSTNIHYHGFHVSPRDSADNVLMQVLPGGRYQYAFSIPQNQSPGTHWYHPHKHGSVALQVTNGMSGAFIVEGGGLDRLTQGPPAMREHLVAIQQIAAQVNLVDFNGDPPYAVNGQVNPVIIMQPGEVQRWRLVNENVAKASNGLIFFATSNPPKMYDVARDGIQFAPVNYTTATHDDSLVMAPGNRLDVFVKAPGTPGMHELRVSPLAEDDVPNVSNRQRARVRARQGQPQEPGFTAAEAPVSLLRVYVPPVPTRSGYATTLPTSLPALPSFLQNLTDPGGTQAQVVFSESGSAGSQPRFFIGTPTNLQQQFNPNSPFITMPLGGTQNWRVENRSTNSLPHPFHIHINPFQVVDVVWPRGKADPNHLLYEQLKAATVATSAGPAQPIWLDVIPLPLPDRVDPTGTPGYVIIRQRYDNFTGPYVIHCHILGHEERGMMQRVDVAGRPVSAAEPSAAPPPGGDHAHHH